MEALTRTSDVLCHTLCARCSDQHTFVVKVSPFIAAATCSSPNLFFRLMNTCTHSLMCTMSARRPQLLKQNTDRKLLLHAY